MTMSKISVLAVHGVGHGDADAALVPSWTQAIAANLGRWNPKLEVEIDFLRYDDLFQNAPLDPAVIASAVARLLASGIVHGIGDLFTGTRGLFDVPAEVRWTAGMVAQWSAEGRLRADARARVLAKLKERPFSLICAHSLGSLITYDALRRNPEGL